VSREAAIALDRADPLAGRRELFLLPPGVIYLDGNSLGALQKGVRERVLSVMDDEWGRGLVRSWNGAGWIDLPSRVGARIARLVGARSDEVIVADSTSVNVLKLLAAALHLRPERRVILSEEDNFPTDLYMAQGLCRLSGRAELRLVSPGSVVDAMSDDVAVVMLTQVDFRTGRRHDLHAITARAHARGALVLWDLAHSAGAFPVPLNDAGADFAVGCGYKYLNGGPGAPAFLYVRRDLQAEAEQPLSGWMGHARPFEFTHRYEPAPGIARHLCGTPPILSLAALDAALDAFDGIDMEAVRRKSVSLMDTFLARVEAEAPSLGLSLASPRDAEQRGSQISYRHPEGYAIMQALIAAGVIGDFRAPDILRFGFTPLCLSHAEAFDAAERLCDVIRSRAFDAPELRRRARVT
jgi:kynureninase